MTRTDSSARGTACRSKTPQERQADLEATLAKLHDGVDSLRSSAGWRAWLQFAAQMPAYSLNNQLLIVAQRPASSAVASYSAWKSLGRQVRRGESGIRILAPNTRRVHGESEEAIGHGQAPALDNVTEPSRHIVTGFRVVSVFDVAQTNGDPLPEPQRPALLEGEAPRGLWEALAQQVTQAGFGLSRAVDASTIGGANGVTDFEAQTVTVRSDVSDAQAVKTLAHELGHVLLHDPTVGGTRAMPCRDVKEVEAESVAFLVTAHAGLDSSDYTFGYVAGWAASQKPNVLSDTATRIMTAARSITTRIDERRLDRPGTSVDAPSPTKSVASTTRVGIQASQSLSVYVA